MGYITHLASFRVQTGAVRAGMESSRRAAAQLIKVMLSLVVAGVEVLGIVTPEQQEILHLQHQVKGIVVDLVT